MGDSGYFYGMLYLEASGRARSLPQDYHAPVAERRHKVAQDFSPGSATEEMEPSPVGTAGAPREFETKTHRQHRCPPLQRTQGRGTHSCAVGKEIETEGWATRQ